MVTESGDYPRLRLLIDGRWIEGEAGEPVLNPADESTLGLVPHVTGDQLDLAIEAAEKGLSTWRSMSPAKRAVIVLRAVDLLKQRSEKIAKAITLEQGRPLAGTRAEVQRACDILEWDANEGRRLYGRVIPGDEDRRQTALRQPIGVVAGFSPWNFPMGSPARKVAGALAAGCALILKPSEETPAGACMLAEALQDAGLPAGVLNIVFGDPEYISNRLVPHPSIRMITLTGSVPVGKKLAELAGRHMKPALMELGGHAPVIVCEDADPVAAAAKSAVAKAANAGQVCVSPTRFFVHDKIYDRFSEAFRERAAAVGVGDGLDPATQMGPLTNRRRVEAIEALVADATAKGAQLLCGGARTGNRGYFFPLTVLGDVPDEADAMRQEPFGPLALLSRVGSVEEAVKKANALPYGLAGYAFTDSVTRADYLADRLECGNLAINHFAASTAETPFGGVKESGYGREGGCEGVEAYTVTKFVSHMRAFDGV